MRSKTLDTLFWIKVLHTVIWIFYNAVIFYLLYSVCVNRIGIWAWVSLGLVILEAAVLVVSGMHCPLTLLAEKYSDSRKANFDIFLPIWLAKYNKQIYSVIVLIILLILAYRLINTP